MTARDFVGVLAQVAKVAAITGAGLSERLDLLLQLDHLELTPDDHTLKPFELC
jgi:hypothetical protein